MSSMNLGTALAVYAVVLKNLEYPLIFPGSWESYNSVIEATSVKLLAKMMEWTALSETVSNQDFNCVNGDATSWNGLWPAIANYFSMTLSVPVPPESGSFQSLPSGIDQPIDTVDLVAGQTELWHRISTVNHLVCPNLPDLFNPLFVKAVLNRRFVSCPAWRRRELLGF